MKAALGMGLARTNPMEKTPNIPVFTLIEAFGTKKGVILNLPFGDTISCSHGLLSVFPGRESLIKNKAKYLFGIRAQPTVLWYNTRNDTLSPLVDCSSISGGSWESTVDLGRLLVQLEVRPETVRREETPEVCQD